MENFKDYIFPIIQIMIAVAFIVRIDVRLQAIEKQFDSLRIEVKEISEKVIDMDKEILKESITHQNFLKNCENCQHRNQ